MSEMDGMEPEFYPEEEAAAPEQAESPETIDEETAEGQSAVVSNSVLSPGGTPLKEGDTVTLTVVKNFGDESEVRVVATPAASESVQLPGGLSQSDAAELDAMDEGY